MAGARLQEKVSALVAHWRRLEALNQAYAAGLAFIGLCVVLALAGAQLFAQRVGVAGALFLAAALLVETYHIAVRCWEQPWGKLAGVLLSATLVPIALGIAAMAVNRATGQQPADYPYAVGMLAPLASGYVVALLAFIVGFLGFPLVFVAAMIRILLAHGRVVEQLSRLLLTRLLAFFAAAILAVVAWQKGEPGYAQMLEWLAARAAYGLDSYGSDACARSTREHVKRLDDTWVISAVSSDKDIHFIRRQCPLTETTFRSR